MMTDLSLNILDVAYNSIKAGASLVEISIRIDTDNDIINIMIADDGCGMSKEVAEKVADPFYTTRTTRKVGLGVPFFKYACESTGGDFKIESELGVGTKIMASLVYSHIDRMPVGDINTTIHTLIVFNLDTDFLYSYRYNDKVFSLDTRIMKEILGGVSLNNKEVSDYIKEYLRENQAEVDGSNVY